MWYHKWVDEIDISLWSVSDRCTEYSCQTGQVGFMIYLPRLKFSCPQKCICLVMSKCWVKNWASKYWLLVIHTEIKLKSTTGLVSICSTAYAIPEVVYCLLIHVGVGQKANIYTYLSVETSMTLGKNPKHFFLFFFTSQFNTKPQTFPIFGYNVKQTLCHCHLYCLWTQMNILTTQYNMLLWGVEEYNTCAQHEAYWCQQENNL